MWGDFLAVGGDRPYCPMESAPTDTTDFFCANSLIVY